MIVLISLSLTASDFGVTESTSSYKDINTNTIYVVIFECENHKPFSKIQFRTMLVFSSIFVNIISKCLASNYVFS